MMTFKEAMEWLDRWIAKEHELEGKFTGKKANCSCTYCRV